MRKLPAYPMFGRGQTRLQPVAVEDVGGGDRAHPAAPGTPSRRSTNSAARDVFTYEEFLRTVAREAGLRPVLVPFPFAAWHLLARVAEFLPRPPVTRNQVELMEVDTVASARMPGLRELGIAPQPVEDDGPRPRRVESPARNRPHAAARRRSRNRALCRRPRPRRALLQRRARARSRSIRTAACARSRSAARTCCCCFRAAARSRPCTCRAAPSRRTTARGRCTSPSPSPRTSLPNGRSASRAHNIAIEGRTTWKRGGESIYFRDPDGHLLELATPGLWAIY